MYFCISLLYSSILIFVIFMLSPNPDNQYLAEHITLLRQSYQRLLGKDFGPANLELIAFAEAIYHAPYVVVSHDTQADPVFNYANLLAQQLFELTWQEFIQLPSRCSAEPPNQWERAQLLESVASQGYSQGYEGIRIAKSGRRFRIQDVTVWNLMDNGGQYHGQAAIYSQWQFL